MLKKANRFSGRVRLLRVFRTGRVTRSQECSVRFAEAKQLRVAVVVSKKVSKSAVVRNRIRRRVYSFMEGRQNSLKPGDYVISIFTETPASQTRTDFDSSLSRLLERAGLL